MPDVVVIPELIVVRVTDEDDDHDTTWPPESAIVTMVVRAVAR